MALESRLGSRIVLGCSTAWGGGRESRTRTEETPPPPVVHAQPRG